MTRKPRIDGTGKSPLQKLKELPWDDIEQLCAEAQDWPAKQLLARIKERHGIALRSEQRLSDFWRWASLQRELRAANEAVANIREIFSQSMPDASAEQTHKFLVTFLTAQGFAEKDPKTLRFVTIEERKRAEGERENRKLHVLETNAAAAKAKLQEVKSTGGLTPETLKQIEEAAGLL